MTVQEMKDEFLILYDKITNFDAPGYEDLEISVLLTKSQERVFLNYYNLLGNRFKEGFEQTESRRKELQELTVGDSSTTPSINQVGVKANGVFFDLPADCMFVLSEEIISASADLCKNNILGEVIPITHDQYTRNKKNPFKKPDIHQKTWRMDYSGRRQELITDGTYTVAQYDIRYIKYLTPIIIGTGTLEGVTGPQNCLLNTILHRRIIDEAVKIAVGITDPQSYQIKTIEQQESE